MVGKVFYFPLLGTPTAPLNALSFYVAGTDTILDVYSDVSGDTAWAQPIVFNAAGNPDGVIYVDPDTAYKVVYTDSDGVAIPGYPVDFIPPGEILNVLTTSITTLTNAQIKALPSTPITLIAAPDSGVRIKVFSATFHADTTAGAYANVNTTYCALGLQTPGAFWATLGLINDVATNPDLLQVTALLAGTADQIVDVCQYLEQPATVANGWVVSTIVSTSDTEANAITLVMDNNGSGALTGGNAANSLVVTVYYALEVV